MGIEEERLRLEWISASEGDRVQHVMNEMTADIKKLGALKLEPMMLHGNGMSLDEQVALAGGGSHHE